MPITGSFESEVKEGRDIMSEQKEEYRVSGQKPTEPTVTEKLPPDDVLLAMLEEVLAKLVSAGWVVIKREGIASKSGRSWVAVYITGKAGKPVIGLAEPDIISLDKVPVTTPKV